MEPDDLLCSRNARPQKALVGRAQWKINQPPSLKDNERAWREHCRGRWTRSERSNEFRISPFRLPIDMSLHAGGYFGDSRQPGRGVNPLYL
jgi:hypothetical protein